MDEQVGLGYMLCLSVVVVVFDRFCFHFFFLFCSVFLFWEECGCCGAMLNRLSACMSTVR